MKWYFYHNRRLRELMNRVMQQRNPPLELPDESQKELIAQLRFDFKQIGRMSAHSSQPSEKVWVNNMNRLLDLVDSEDPRTFLHWDVIQKAMFITNAMYILLELSFLKKQSSWAKRWQAAIREDTIGEPIPYWRCPSSSGNLIHHAYHLAQLEAKMNIDVSKFDYVVEYGGGYGSMCRLFHNLGFSGTYIIFDLPHFSALQKYFLSSLNIHVGQEKAVGEMIVQLTTDSAELEDFAGRFAEKKGLLLATWSVSEMPLELREQLRPLYKQFAILFFAFQSVFEEVDNVKYFHGIEQDENQFDWQRWEVQSLPTNYYLAGKANNRGEK